MSWTILGSEGTIGRRLVVHLRSQGKSVFTPGRDDEVLYKRHLGHVVYAIGLTADFRQRPFDTVQAHVSKVADLLQKADFESFLYLSSTRVYARSISGREDSPVSVVAQDPSDLYSLSKLCGESLCLQDTRKTIRVVRLSNVVGGDEINSVNFLPSLVREAINGRIVLKTALNSAKDYIHIDDLVELLPLIVCSGRERLYNVASGSNITHAQWINQISSRINCVLEVVPGSATVSFPPIDISRIHSEFSFQSRPILEIINRLLTSSQGTS